MNFVSKHAEYYSSYYPRFLLVISRVQWKNIFFTIENSVLNVFVLYNALKLSEYEMTLKYVLKKLTLLIFSLFFVASLTFFLMKIIPGDPFLQEQAVPEEIMKSLYAHYGLDKPWYEQYMKYLKGIVTFDLGPSFKYENRTVGDIIYEGFPVSLLLGLEALCLSIFFGILLGSIGAAFRSGYQDHLAMFLAVIGISMPSFILATFLQYVFAM